MKHCLYLLFLLTFLSGIAQQENLHIADEERLEDLAESDETAAENNETLSHLAVYLQHPLLLNYATEAELSEFGELSALEVKNLCHYRTLLGKFISIYELQAVPGFSLDLIRRILPYIAITDQPRITQHIRGQLPNGEQLLLLRSGWVAEPSQGFVSKDSSNPSFTGSRPRLLARYFFNSKQLLHFGITGEKDPGEQFFQGTQKKGFDFYSFHVFVRKWRCVKALALGDYTINIGQGLIRWQGFAYKKSSGVIAIKRQSESLKPYRSTGEYNFYRGLASLIETGHWKALAFISSRMISANISAGQGNLQNQFITSFLPSGLHRTSSEVADRNNVRFTSYGGSLQYSKAFFQVSANLVSDHFSLPVIKKSEPYNTYSFSGTSSMNASVDYSWTVKNFHLFGEAAIDRRGRNAVLAGIMMSLGKVADLALLYRKIDKAFQSIAANAFTENITPSDEEGGYIGLSLQPSRTVKMDVYADFFASSWLRYRVSSPSYGCQYLVQLTWKPDKKTEFYSRFRMSDKAANESGGAGPLQVVGRKRIFSWRIHTSIRLNGQVTLRNRVEFCWMHPPGGHIKESGSLVYLDLSGKEIFRLFSGSLRIQFFDTGGYDSRLYAYENDLPYLSQIPSFFDKGLRGYITIHRSIHVQGVDCQAALKIGRMIFADKTTIGTGLDAIEAAHRTDIGCQLLLKWG